MTIFAKSTVSGLQVPSPSGTRVAKTSHIACRDSFRKPGPSYPALFFLVHLQEIASPCAGVRSYRKRSLPPLPGRVSAQGVAVPAAGCIVGIEKRPHPRTKRRGIARPRSEHLIFLSVGRSGRQLRGSRSYAMVLGGLRRCKTAFYRTGHCATIYGAGAVMRHRSAILYRMSAAIFTR